MCTLTFLPLENNNFILTSNRDENKSRETLPPEKYTEKGVDLFFPKDKMAGGTWIGVSSRKRFVCLLNGAFKNHIKRDNYKYSRGIIVKEILINDDFLDYIEFVNLDNIEPFTLVIVDFSLNDVVLYELIWDENKKHFKKLEAKPRIWSSSSLYSENVKIDRKKWFEKWLRENQSSKKSILEFHHSQNEDIEQSILMKRPYVETVSITSIYKINGEITIDYEDLVRNKNSKKFLTKQK